MSIKEAKEAIDSWVQTTPFFCVHLPNGSWGRPGESCPRVTSVIETDSTVVIDLGEGKILITLCGQNLSAIASCDGPGLCLEISDFDSAEFAAHYCGKTLIFRSGEIEFRAFRPNEADTFEWQAAISRLNEGFAKGATDWSIKQLEPLFDRPEKAHSWFVAMRLIVLVEDGVLIRIGGPNSSRFRQMKTIPFFGCNG